METYKIIRIVIEAIGVLSDYILCSEKTLTFITTAKSSRGNMPCLLRLKVNGRVMLTNNVAINDRLIKKQIGSIAGFKFQVHQVTIHVRFNDRQESLRKITKSHVGQNNRWVTI